MSEETLSQAAIDALMSQQSGENAPAQPPPPAPEPEPEVAVAPEPDPEPVAESVTESMPAHAPVAVPLSSVAEKEVTSLSGHLEKIEAAVARIDALEKTVKSGGAQQGTPDEDILRRLESIELSIMGICQIQQESPSDALLAKIPQLERELPKISRLERELAKVYRLEKELANMNAMVQNLSNQLQGALKQLKKTTVQVNKAMQGLKGTWGYNLQSNYECQHCGSRGYVVGLVKCSDCGEEEWWGWWPPEEEEYEDDLAPAIEGTEWEGNW